MAALPRAPGGEPGPRLDGRHRFKETEFYDRQIAEVLEQTPAAGHAFRLEVSDRQLVLNVEMSERLFANTISSPADPQRKIESELLERLGLEAEVQFVQPTSPQ